MYKTHNCSDKMYILDFCSWGQMISSKHFFAIFSWAKYSYIDVNKTIKLAVKFAIKTKILKNNDTRIYVIKLISISMNTSMNKEIHQFLC